MSTLHDSGLDDQQLVRYLLKLLPDEEAERLDELTVADEEVAWHLQVVEDELVDAYVTGTLAGELRERFESFYLASERRRERVKAAGSFLRAVDRAAVSANLDQDAAPEVNRTPDVEPHRPAPEGVRWYRRIVWPSTPAWAPGAAVALVLLACGALLVQDLRLRSGLAEAQRESAALDRRAHELEQQLNDQRGASAEVARELARLRASLAEAARPEALRASDQPASVLQTLTAALVLLPQMRAGGSIPSLTVPRGTDGVTFELRLESNDFARYQVALKDPATNQIMWRSGPLTARSAGGTPLVAIIVPTRAMKSQHYSLELIGRSPAGKTEVVSSYPVRIVLP